MSKLLLLIPPITSGVAWIATVLILLILWLVDGRPKYEVTSPDISYISNIGSEYIILFIVGASTTALFFAITLIIFIGYHRHVYKQSQNRNDGNIGNGNGNNAVTFRKPRTWADVVSFIFGMISSAALVLLAIFDSENHDSLHWIFTMVFIFGAILCAIFNVIGISTSRVLRRRKMSSFVLKIIFIILTSGIVAAMLILMYSCSSDGTTLTPRCNELRSASAVLEWCLAGLFFIFILTWILDFS